MHSDRLIIFDTTLRDCEQIPGASMNKDEKVRIAKALEKLRVDVIDPKGRATEWCRYTTTRRAKQGAALFTWIPAVNDLTGEWTVRVREVIAGKQIVAL